MISRNALLALRDEIESGMDVWVITDAENVRLDRILGVEEDSHVVAMVGDTKTLIAIDRIVSVEITQPEEDTL